MSQRIAVNGEVAGETDGAGLVIYEFIIALCLREKNYEVLNNLILRGEETE